MTTSASSCCRTWAERRSSRSPWGTSWTWCWGLTLSGKHCSFDFKLDHWHYDVFKASDHLSKVAFLTNLKGDIDGLSVAVEPAVAPVVFTRKASEAMKDPKFLAQFQGTYEIRGVTLTITLKGNSLFGERSGQPTVELVPYKGTEF